MRFLLVLLVGCLTVDEIETTTTTEAELTDPTLPGAYAVGSMRYRWRDAAYPGSNGTIIAPIAGEVRYPALFAGEGAEPQPGVLPVVIFAHGNQLPNDGHVALITHLASHGYIAIAIDLQALTSAPPDPIEFKAAHIRANVDMLMLPVSPVLRGHIDTTAISLAGHSQGGDAALRAAYYAQLGGGAFQARTVMAVAPTDGSGIAGTGNTPNAVAAPYFGLYGSLDGDVGISAGFPFGSPQRGGLGFRAYDRATGSKAYAYVEGACHNLFNELYPLCERNPPSPLSQADHQKLLRGYLTAFLAWQYRGDPTAQPLFESGPLPGVSAVVHHQIHDQSALVLDDFADTKPNAALGGAINIDSGFAEVTHDTLWLLDHSAPHTSGGALLRWTAPGATHRIQMKKTVDASPFTVVSMRLAQAVGMHDALVGVTADQTALDAGQLGSTMTAWINANGGVQPGVQVVVESAGLRWRIENGSQRLMVIRDAASQSGTTFWMAVRNANISERHNPMTVRIRLTDTVGTSASFTAAVDAPVVPPPITTIPLDRERRTLAALQTIRIPLTRFSAIDLGRVREVALEVTTSKGELLIDDIELSR